MKYSDFIRKKTLFFIISFFILLFLLTAVSVPKTKPQVASSFVTAAPSPFYSPSPTQSILPSVTLKPAETLTPAAIQTNYPDRFSVKVVNVVDGDTVKIETGETVRYIGIDTPESVHPKKSVQCFAKEASFKNEELVLGKTVELEKDITDKDKYGRLLRYVWIEDQLVNEILVREGYAYSLSFPPDVKYQDRFIEAQRLARQEQTGLWGSSCQSQNAPQPTAKPQSVQTGSFTCDCSKSCSKMTSCAEAQYQLENCGCTARDGDGDGLACDSDCQ